MLRRPSFAASVLSLACVGTASAVVAGCATEASVEETASSGSTGGGGAAEGAGGAGGEAAGGGPIDAGPDGDDASAEGPCTKAADCAFLTEPCNVGTCINGVCVKMPADDLGVCDDGIFCTVNDVCQDGKCMGGTPKLCPSPDNCHVGVCDEAAKACILDIGNNGALCDDNDVCTGTGVCVNGACSKGSSLDCSMFNSACSVGVCDPQLGCQAAPTNEGGPCDDLKKNPCTAGTCSQGKCVSHPANEGGACDDLKKNPCSAGLCTQGSCVSHPANEGRPCEDGLFCTVNDFCQNAACVSGAARSCEPPGACFLGVCDELNRRCSATPGNDGAPCDDLDTCTKGTTCSGGACVGGQPDGEGVACDDGNACTTGETCAGGVCGGGSGPEVYFADDFHDNAKGWLLDPEWGIGPAKASSGSTVGADPDTDHSPSADNGVAGVVIGGNASATVHPFYYLTSPPFDTQVAKGPVSLGFYRWLNSDYHPFMHNSIDVWDGAKWVNLWKSGSFPSIEDSPPDGAGWTFIQLDLTPYKSAAMQIRFGFDVTLGSVLPVGSWNIDDVLVASAVCP